MASTIEIPSAHETLLGVIRRVRARWRLKLALRGAAIVLGALVVAVLLGAYIMQSARFAPGAITGVRIAEYVTLALLLIQYVVRPLLRRASDEHVALYLEEHEPSLDAAVLERGRAWQAHARHA
jgi:small neutral amino acid transporter SnatA (MarC family)